MSNIIKVNRIKPLIFLMWLISIIMFLTAPDYYSHEFVILCGSVSFLSILFFIYVIKIENWFNFDVLFIFSYVSTNFFYPIFFYYDEPYLLFKYPFNHDVISKATALATCALLSWMLGRVYYIHLRTTNKSFSRIDRNILLLRIKRKNSYLANFAILVFILFLFNAGAAFLAGTYASKWESASASYLILLFLIILRIIIVVEIVVSKMNQKGLKSISKKIGILAAVYCLIFLAAGDRGGPLQVFLLILGVLGFVYWPFKLKHTVIITLVGLLVMSIIGLARMNYDSGILDSSVGLLQKKDAELNIFKDLTINNRTLFVATDYINKNNDYFYGVLFIEGVSGVFPFLNSFIRSITDVKPHQLDSSEFFSYLDLGENPRFGMGTNLVGSIYLNFGFFGVIVLMFLFGLAINYFTKKMVVDKRIIFYIIYGILMSYSVYVSRSDITVFLRPLIWSFVIYRIFFKKLTV